MLTLCENYNENIKRIDRTLRVDESFDLIKKTLWIAEREFTLYYIDGFVEGNSMNKLMTYFLGIQTIAYPENAGGEETARYFLQHHLPHVEAELTETGDTMMQMVLSGTSLLIGEGFGRYAIVLDSRTYPTRSVGEPDNDRVMVGSRDGFVETLVFNTALIRRRVRDPELTMKYFTIGNRSRSDVVLCYLNGQADPKYVKYLEQKLSNIKTGALTMAHESLAELLIDRRWYNPFPKIRYTERPDVAAAQVLEGSVLIVCDNTPEVMILPSTIFDFMQESNDYYFPPLIGTYIRIVRHIVFWATLLLIPTWFLLTKHPGITPAWLQFILPESTGKVPIFAQLLLVEFMIDGLRMASMNTPDMLSNSLSVVGGLILGDFAVSIGWLIPEVIVYMAFVSIANFTQRSYELGYAFKFMRIGLIILIQLFNYIGFVVGLLLCLILLLTNKTANRNRSYLYPLIPFNGKALLALFVRPRKDRYPDSIGVRVEDDGEKDS